MALLLSHSTYSISRYATWHIPAWSPYVAPEKWLDLQKLEKSAMLALGTYPTMTILSPCNWLSADAIRVAASGPTELLLQVEELGQGTIIWSVTSPYQDDKAQNPIHPHNTQLTPPTSGLCKTHPTHFRFRSARAVSCGRAVARAVPPCSPNALPLPAPSIFSRLRLIFYNSLKRDDQPAPIFPVVEKYLNYTRPSRPAWTTYWSRSSRKQTIDFKAAARQVAPASRSLLSLSYRHNRVLLRQLCGNLQE